MIKKIISMLFLCVLPTLCIDLPAQQNVMLDTQHYVQAQKTNKISVILVLCGANAPFLKKMGKLIKNDLEFTDQFTVAEYYQEGSFTNTSFSFYQGQGSFLITLNMSKNDEGALEWRLYKYTKKGKGQFIKGEETIIGVGSDWWAHAISDEVYRQLTGNPSPFLTKIAYCKQMAEDTKGNRVCIANYNGTHEKLVVPFTPKSSQKNKNKKEESKVVVPYTTYMAPAWSKNAKVPQLLYSEYTPINTRLMISDLINQPTIVTDFDGLNMLPTFSADGKEALLCLSVEGKTDIYRYVPYKKRSGGEYIKITKNNGINLSPAVLNDSSIAFCSDYEFNVPHIYIMDKNGDNTTRLSQIGQGKGMATSPAYSSQPNKIAYVQSINGIFQLMVYDIATETTTQISFDYYHKGNPSWSPCGNYIICSMHNSISKKLGCFKLLTNTWQFINPTSLDFTVNQQDEVSYTFPAWSPFFASDLF